MTDLSYIDSAHVQVKTQIDSTQAFLSKIDSLKTQNQQNLQSVLDEEKKYTIPLALDILTSAIVFAGLGGTIARGFQYVGGEFKRLFSPLVNLMPTIPSPKLPESSVSKASSLFSGITSFFKKIPFSKLTALANRLPKIHPVFKRLAFIGAAAYQIKANWGYYKNIVFNSDREFKIQQGREGNTRFEQEKIKSELKLWSDQKQITQLKNLKTWQISFEEINDMAERLQRGLAPISAREQVMADIIMPSPLNDLGPASASMRQLRGRWLPETTSYQLGSEGIDHTALSDFYKKYPEMKAENKNAIPLQLTDESFAKINEVNTDINNKIVYNTDFATSGKTESFDIATSKTFGDCDNYAFTKAKELRAAFPTAPIFVSFVNRLGVEKSGHAVVVVRTDRGDLVLDSDKGINEIKPWYMTDYQFNTSESLNGSDKVEVFQ